MKITELAEKWMQKYSYCGHVREFASYLDERFELVEKCFCCCHENKLNKPYMHDTKCCEDINGEVEKKCDKPLNGCRK